jgi:ApeA N-terminal domain 1
METQKTYLGKWWIVNPNDQVYKDKDFSGTLSISERGKISLVLMVDFEFNDYFEFPVVNGIIDDTEEGNCATLLNCKMLNSSFKFGGAAVSLVEYTCDFLLLHPQVHITAPAKVASFKKIIIEYNHLFNWLGKSSVEYKQGKRFILTRVIKKPLTIKMKVLEAEVLIKNGVNISANRNVKYNQKAWIEIKSPQKLTIHEWLEKFISPIQDLLTLSIDSATQLTSFKLSLIGQRGIDKTSKYRDITVLINGLKANNDISQTILYSHEIIFSFPYLVCHGYQLEDILSKWFCLINTTSSNTDNLIHLYKANKYREIFDSIPMFLNISQALELYHNSILDSTLSIDIIEKPLSESEFNKIRGSIERMLGNQSPEVKKWVMKKIKYNQPKPDKSFIIKLKNICNKANLVFDDFGVGLDDFCKKVRGTRNYYTHYGIELREEALTQGDLYWLTQGISYLLLYCLLLELGFTPDHVHEMVRIQVRG